MGTRKRKKGSCCASDLDWGRGGFIGGGPRKGEVENERKHWFYGYSHADYRSRRMELGCGRNGNAAFQGAGGLKNSV